MIFNRSVKSAVMKVLKSNLKSAQDKYDAECKRLDEEAKVAKEKAFDFTVNAFTNNIFGKSNDQDKENG